MQYTKLLSTSTNSQHDSINTDENILVELQVTSYPVYITGHHDNSHRYGNLLNDEMVK